MNLDSDSDDGFLVSQATWLRIRKPVISVFIIFHLTIIWFWLFPTIYFHGVFPALNFPQKDQPFKNYMVFLGLDQDFGVFAPKPRDTNVHLVAIVTHKDGTLQLWEYPRLERMTLFEQLFRERYRKFAHDTAVWEKFSVLWPDLAKYIARLNNDPRNPPISVSLVRYSAPIPVPPAGLKEPLPPHFETSTIITFSVQPDDLK